MLSILYPFKMKHTLIACGILTSLIAITTTSCKHQDQQQQSMPSADIVIKDSAKTSTVISLDMMMSNIPDPTEVSKELSKEGIQLNKSLLNTPDKASSYSTTFQQGVNMGVYGADLGYLASYNQLQDVMQYFVQISKLANGLGITSVFDQKLMEHFKNAANGNKDSLNAVVQTAFERSQAELYSSKRATVGTLIFAGGWIEGLYIATNLVKDEKNKKNEELYNKIWNHLYAVNYLVKALSDYQKTNTDCANMLKILQPLSDISSKLTNDGLNLQDIQNIKAAVTDMRNKLI